MNDAEATHETRSRSNTRKRLIDAAIEVFAAQGLKGTTVDDICAAADFTRGAFYSNFSSKEEVFLQGFDQLADEALDNARAAVEQTPAQSGPEFVAEALDRFKPLDRNWFLIHGEYQLLALRDPLFAAHASTKSTGYAARLGELLLDTMTRIGLEPLVSFDVMMAVIMPVYQSNQVLAYQEGADAERAKALVRDALTALIEAFTRPVDTVNTEHAHQAHDAQHTGGAEQPRDVQHEYDAHQPQDAPHEHDAPHEQDAHQPHDAPHEHDARQAGTGPAPIG